MKRAPPGVEIIMEQDARENAEYDQQIRGTEQGNRRTEISRLMMLAFLFAVGPGVQNEKDGQQHGDRDTPHWPAMMQHPPERHAFEIAQEQRWVADGGERAADVGDHKNKENDMKGPHV